jgi:flotillin
LRTVESQQQVQLAQQKSLQTVKEQEKLTKEKEMNVAQVSEVRKAEILRQVKLVEADQAKQVAEVQKQTSIVQAQQSKEVAALVADGALEAKKREAEGITLEGEARASAAKASLLAPVEAQTTLAKEIGKNDSYQKYLVTIRKVEADQAVGIEQAKALGHAQIKIIANTGDAASGLTKATDIFTSKGGTQLGAMLEGLANTDTGKAVLEKIGVKDRTAESLNGHGPV